MTSFVQPGLRRVLRPAFVALPLVLSACASSGAPQTFPQMSYGYLTPLRLNVASISIDNRWTPRSGLDVSGISPEPPAQALRQMAQDRLLPNGSTGRAVFTIQDASILQQGDRLDGHLAVRLDILNADGNPVGFAEARVARTTTNVHGDTEALRQTLYTLTRQMMDDMNVELEYQVRRSLRDWLQSTSPASAAVPTPVEAQPLGVPGAPPPVGAPVGPSVGAPPAPPSVVTPGQTPGAPGAGLPPGTQSLGTLPYGTRTTPGIPASPPTYATPPYAPPPSGSPAYGAPSYGSPGYGAPSYPAPPSPSYPPSSYPQSGSYGGSPSYSAPSYSTPSYSAPSYTAPSYQAPPSPQPSYQAPSYTSPSYPAQSYPYAAPPSYQAPTGQPPVNNGDDQM